MIPSNAEALLTLCIPVDPTVRSRRFNLWTESYGGHWGPTFFNYFFDQNVLIREKKTQGVEIQLETLGIINGLISQRVQMPSYPEFAYNNTYGIRGINETVYNFTRMALSMPGGTLYLVEGQSCHKCAMITIC